jgi:tRNA-specific 2-thiouridylase
MSERVFVGLSGGVDSALATALLVEQGYDVTAVYMRNWSRDLPGFRCPWAEELADAERVAYAVGCELVVWDFEEEYRRTVVDYLIDSYRRGLTPNPDVMCNQTIKFGSFAERAFREGADLIASGHYARVAQLGGAEGGTGVVQPGGAEASLRMETGGDSASRTVLLRAADEHKDQTYFLWRVPEEAFSRTLFPIGDYASKAQVREACAERGLGVETKPDSDGICFVGPVGIRTFLLDELERRAGEVRSWETGEVLGQHDGAFLFTVGQRRGLDLGGGPARYVVKTDVESNVVWVTDDRDSPALMTRTLELEDVHWICGVAPQAGEYLLRMRHTGPLTPAWVEPTEPSRALVRFDEDVRRVACGQSAVVYDGLCCLGGGLIAGPIPQR